MKKNLEYQWFLSTNDPLTIQFYYTDLYVWIGIRDLGKIDTIGVMDLALGFTYVITLDINQGTYFGEVRPCEVLENEVTEKHSETFTWMTVDDKTEMLGQMRRAVSFRRTPLPLNFKNIWTNALSVITDLDIIDPGRKRYSY